MSRNDFADGDAPSIVEELRARRGERTMLHRVERRADAPDECTLYPADATAEEITTAWMTASEGSFVPLADAR
ncbi:hypothetical protein ACFQPA_22075 [Halomarina halobia]|uniref:DUF7511 domain-containing protein n=1 Tax=Halomarina halobia TaxID=3033386 RepID=A0ABD6A9F9_9EURY|nr:hypothetical protein [Halomarina sp. PSR21]